MSHIVFPVWKFFTIAYFCPTSLKPSAAAFYPCFPTFQTKFLSEYGFIDACYFLVYSSFTYAVEKWEVFILMWVWRMGYAPSLLTTAGIPRTKVIGVLSIKMTTLEEQQHKLAPAANIHFKCTRYKINNEVSKKRFHSRISCLVDYFLSYCLLSAKSLRQ